MSLHRAGTGLVSFISKVRRRSPQEIWAQRQSDATPGLKELDWLGIARAKETSQWVIERCFE